MNVTWLLGILASLLFITVIIMGWRSWRLRRRLREYSALIRRSADIGFPFPDIKPDFPGLENLSNAIKLLVDAFSSKYSNVETDRALLASILDQMTDGVIIANSDGGVSYVNPAAERIFDVKSAVGRRVAEVLRHYQLVEAWKLCLESREAQDETVELPSRRQFLHMIALPDSQTGGVLLLIQNLTQVHRLETVRRDFISNVSHELRTPLASLKALTETLRDGALEDPEAAPRFLGRMETEVDALTQMTQELLDLSRIESGQVALEFIEVEPARLVDASADRMRAQAERGKLELNVEISSDLPKIRADRNRLEQVLVNLIHNAIKFTPPGGSVQLAAQVESGFIRFSVQDTGVGMPEEDLERIFERFYKSDRARSGGGTGLGLSISRHIVEAHGGRIWAESREGEGSTFYFTIPIS